MWPNPTVERATVALDADFTEGQFLLFDLGGRQVLRQYFQQPQFEVPLNQLPAGTYVYRLENANGRLLNTGKVTVK